MSVTSSSRWLRYVVRPEHLPLTARLGVIEYDGRDEQPLTEAIELTSRFKTKTSRASSAGTLPACHIGRFRRNAAERITLHEQRHRLCCPRPEHTARALFIHTPCGRLERRQNRDSLLRRLPFGSAYGPQRMEQHALPLRPRP